MENKTRKSLGASAQRSAFVFFGAVAGYFGGLVLGAIVCGILAAALSPLPPFFGVASLGIGPFVTAYHVGKGAGRYYDRPVCND